jgi:hypothetical protein
VMLTEVGLIGDLWGRGGGSEGNRGREDDWSITSRLIALQRRLWGKGEATGVLARGRIAALHSTGQGKGGRQNPPHHKAPSADLTGCLEALPPGLPLTLSEPSSCEVGPLGTMGISRSWPPVGGMAFAGANHRLTPPPSFEHPRPDVTGRRMPACSRAEKSPLSCHLSFRDAQVWAPNDLVLPINNKQSNYGRNSGHPGVLASRDWLGHIVHIPRALPWNHPSA